MEVRMFHVNGGYRVERITTDSHQFPRERRSLPQSVQNLSSSSAPYHKIFAFLIPLLVGVIEINNVQEKNKSLIETHSMSMCLFLLALLIYAFPYFATMKFKLQIFKAIVVISGSLCSVSLVSITLPHPYGHFSFIMWAFVVLLVAYNRRLHKKIWQFWNRFGGNNQLLDRLYADTYPWMTAAVAKKQPEWWRRRWRQRP
ncbi:hypothetical protein CUMW_228640 [Citrus unshiu]|uniref:Uncharacterized protein n=1 Tax=Citrus unshiu TaxID=55188 RepID=A0A2H5QGQ9_CITUN|nr:hypothetical protein CUMW_228640 [Citrus unshiu]